VKVPEPLQPAVEGVSVHVPVTVLFFTVPFRVRTLFAAELALTTSVSVPELIVLEK
jgi:hypothetical protein